MSKMSRWFRLYEDVLNDPKVQRLEPTLFKHLINIWCLSSKHDGKLPGVEDISFGLRITKDEVKKTLDFLVGAELLEKKGRNLVPHNWNGRQFKSDVSTERVKQFRKRRETVSETPPDTDTDTDTDTESKTLAQNKNLSYDAFDTFWEVYPRKVGKGSARTAFIKQTVSLQTLLDGVHRLGQYVSESDPTFTPHPATWLNREGWLDEYPAEQKAKHWTEGICDEISDRYEPRDSERGRSIEDCRDAYEILPPKT